MPEEYTHAVLLFKDVCIEAPVIFTLYKSQKIRKFDQYTQIFSFQKIGIFILPSCLFFSIEDYVYIGGICFYFSFSHNQQ